MCLLPLVCLAVTVGLSLILAEPQGLLGFALSLVVAFAGTAGGHRVRQR
jgi:hypothetical protein